MNIPNIIRIGAFDYDIIKRNSPFIGEALNNGLHDGNKLQIEINTALPDARQFQVMWHETLHGLMDCSGLDPADEERIVEAMSAGIVQVIRDNPWMGKL